MTSYNDLLGDPVDVLHPTVKVFAVDDNETLPVRHISISLTPGEGVLELPRGAKGEKGERGTPTAPFIHQGDRTSAQIAALALTEDEEGYAYRNTTNNNMHYWNGSSWIVFANAFGAQGPPGPAGTLSGVVLEMLDEDDDPEASVTGSVGSQVLRLGIPETPGPQGATGPASGISVAEDYDDSVPPSNGQVLTYNSGTSLWKPGAPTGVRHYTMPTSLFSNTGTQLTDDHILLASLPLDQLSYASALHVTGRFIVNQLNTSRLAIQVRVGGPGPDSGTVVAEGIALAGAGEQVVIVTPHFSTAANPSTATAPSLYVGTIPANHTGANGTVYVSVIRIGGLGLWEVKADYAQVSILRHAVG